MKKIYFGITALAVALAAVIFAFAASFTDIEDGAYYSDAADRMAERGILSGYGDGGFYGGESVTRAQIAALVCKMLGKTTEAAALAGKTSFNDVVDGAWYTGYINYAMANGIIIGDGDGNFRPDDFVKYEEVIKVVVCVLGLDEDVKIDPVDWSKEYIKAASDAKLIEKLIGEKGTPMLRSDIAVICDAAMAVLDGACETTEEITTTKKSVSCVSGGTKPKPAVTTAATTTVTTTTAATTTVTTTTVATTAVTTALTFLTENSDPEDALPIFPIG